MKRFTLKFLIVVLPILTVLGYYRLFVMPNINGDLGELAEINFGKEYVNFINSKILNKNKVLLYDSTTTGKFLLVTIGDSFSQQGMVGYQNYLAHKLNFQLLNIKNHNNSPEQTLIDLINNGTFNSLGVKTVIIEKVERFFIDGLKNIDFTSKINYKYIFTSNHNLPNKKPVLQRATSWIRLSLGYENPVKTAVLRDTLFTHTTLGSTLFFYQNDLNFQRISDSDIKLASHNLKKLNRFCLKNKVQLIYLLAADKYDIYQPFIVNSNYPGNHVLDLFSKNIEESYFINTKELLQPLLAKGVKDIYKLNDSHWSPKGHEIVANELYKRLVNMNLK